MEQRPHIDSFTSGRISPAIAAVAAGKPVVVVDGSERKNQGTLMFAAELSTTSLMAFTVRYTSGFVSVALTSSDCKRLDLPAIVANNEARFGTDYRVSVDLVGTGTGISATDRCKTATALASFASTADDFSRPGHVVTRRAHDGGVLARPGHTEASVDLVRMAGLYPAAVLCEIVSVENPFEIATWSESEQFARQHDLQVVSIDELAAFRAQQESLVRRTSKCHMPTVHGNAQLFGYSAQHGRGEHVALVVGDVADSIAVPFFAHVECLAGDVLRSTACTCGADTAHALQTIASSGLGVFVHMRPPGPARACGILTDGNADVDNCAAQIAADIARDLKVSSVRLQGTHRLLAETFLSKGVEIEMPTGSMSTVLEGHRL